MRLLRQAAHAVRPTDLAVPGGRPSHRRHASAAGRGPADAARVRPAEGARSQLRRRLRRAQADTVGDAGAVEHGPVGRARCARLHGRAGDRARGPRCARQPDLLRHLGHPAQHHRPKDGPVSVQILSDLLTQAAQRSPDAPAVLHGAASCSYAELDERATRIARTLQNCGVAPGSRVGVHMEKSIDAVAAVYGILRAGAAYVPADPAGPIQRTAVIFNDAAVACVVLDEARLAAWSAPDAPSLPTSRLLVPGADIGGGAGPVTQRAISQDLAYVLYTSGSTGTPKGVMLTHTNALGFVNWAVDHYRLDATD